jgi:hypothetical protein
MSDKERELNPCPFCGRPASIQGDFGLQALACSDRLGECPGSTVHLPAHTPQRRAEAITAWNTRAALDATPAEPSAVELTDGVIEEIGHRTAWRYKFSSDPHHSSTYTFNKACLIAFARALAAAKGKA